MPLTPLLCFLLLLLLLVSESSFDALWSLLLEPAALVSLELFELFADEDELGLLEEELGVVLDEELGVLLEEELGLLLEDEELGLDADEPVMPLEEPLPIVELPVAPEVEPDVPELLEPL